jgi:anti-sigma factor RsiW
MTEPADHPEELLAAYVDDELDEAGRAQARAHLSVCDRCREQVRGARRARGALRALPEVEVPVGILRPVARSVAERSKPTAPRSDDHGARPGREGRDPTRVLAGLAIAAALVIVGAIAIVPLLRGGGNSTSLSPQAQAVSGAPAKVDVSRLPSPSVQRERVEYDTDSIKAVAQTAARDPVAYARSQTRNASVDQHVLATPGTGAQAGAAVPVTGTAPSPTPAAQASGTKAPESSDNSAAPGVSASRAQTASRCVAQWSRGEGIVQKNLHPLRIIEATYQGQPATIAVFLQTGGPKVPGKVLIWVLDSDCHLISFVQRAL